VRTSAYGQNYYMTNTLETSEMRLFLFKFMLFRFYYQLFRWSRFTCADCLLRIFGFDDVNAEELEWNDLVIIMRFRERKAAASVDRLEDLFRYLRAFYKL
jgi:hypothetical protein